MRNLILILLLVGFAGCQKATDALNVAPAADISTQKVQGKIGGQDWSLVKAGYKVWQNANGVKNLGIQLVAQDVDVCRYFMKEGDPFMVTLVVPIKVGESHEPESTAVFSRFENGVARNLVAENVTARIQKIEGGHLVGGISAKFGDSAVSGQFDAISCDDEESTPPPVPTPDPAPSLDVLKTLKGFEGRWAGSSGVTTPGRDGSLSLFISDIRSEANVVKFQIYNQCCFVSDMPTCMQATSDINSEILEADDRGRVFRQCRGSRYEVGRMTSTSIAVDLRDCWGLFDNKTKIPFEFNARDNSSAGVSITSPNFDGDKMTCAGVLNRAR